MSHRFYVSRPIVVGEEISIAGAEAHHMSHVMRLTVGDEVTLFDGTGAECVARLTRIEKRGVDVEVSTRNMVDRESALAVELAVALPRGDRQTWLVEKAVELGVRSVVPLVTERGVARPTDKALGRLRRVVIESSKQCGRNRLLQIEPPAHLSDYLAQVVDPLVTRWFAHPQESEPLALPLKRDSTEFRIVIGPEGGFTNDETRLAREAGWLLGSCGPRIMRVETAAIAISAKILLP